MTVKDRKEKQQRFTLEDTLRNQEELRHQLKILIADNRCLELQERPKYYGMLAKGLITQGAINPVSMVIEGGWFTFESVQGLALQKFERLCASGR